MRRPLLFVCVCLFVLMALYMQFFEKPFPGSEATVPDGEEVCIRGQVYDKEYGQRDGREILIIYLQDILISRENKDSHQEIFQEKSQISDYQSMKRVKCEIFVSDLPCLKDDRVYLPCLGEWIEVSGEWRNFQRATNPGQFDQANYYTMEGIGGKLTNLRILSKDGGTWVLWEEMYRLRQRLVERLYGIFEAGEASILAKMLLGDGSGLDPEIRELYQNNGIAHILSISGLHISLLGMGLYSLLRKLRIPLWGAAVTGGVFLVLYGMLTGFSVSACRAVGMYLIHMLGEIWGKTYDMLTAMGVLLVILLFNNPMLVYHSGFLLSFSSVCGVGLLGPVLGKNRSVWMVRPYDSRGLKWFKKGMEGISSGFWVSLSVTMFTLPLQLFFFYQIPVYSVFLNLLVIPFVGLAMAIGIMVLILPGAVVLAPIEGMVFDWFEGCCRFFEKIPGHILLTGCPPFYKILIYYGVLLAGIIMWRRIGKKGVLGALGVATLLLTINVRRDAQITFLDVGQGDCICVQTEDGSCFLFDGGSGSMSDVGERIILPFLKYQGINTLDGVFLSHPDADHVNGVLELLQEKDICIKNLLLPDVAERESEFAEILRYATDTKIQYVSEGMQSEGADWEIICLHPPVNYRGEDNAYSACFYVKVYDTAILLTGDIEGEGEAALVNELNRMEVGSVDVLKVAHHGSRNSTSGDFLEQVAPSLAVISCGRKNLYGHPHEETLRRLADTGAEVFTTSRYGAVSIEVQEGNHIRVRCYVTEDMNNP